MEERLNFNHDIHLCIHPNIMGASAELCTDLIKTSIKPYELFYLNSIHKARQSNTSSISREHCDRFDEINARVKRQINNYCPLYFVKYLNVLLACQLFETHKTYPSYKLRYRRYDRHALSNFATLKDASILVQKLDLTVAKDGIQANKT